MPPAARLRQTYALAEPASVGWFTASTDRRVPHDDGRLEAPHDKTTGFCGVLHSRRAVCREVGRDDPVAEGIAAGASVALGLAT